VTVSALLVVVGIAVGAIPAAVIGAFITRMRLKPRAGDSDVDRVIKLNREIERLRGELLNERRK
jgi:hypothetical protein